MPGRLPVICRLGSAATPALAMVASSLLVMQPVHATVNLEWRPLQQPAAVGEIVEIACYAVSDTGLDQPIGGLQLVLSWDSDRLELLGNLDPCTADPCSPNTYRWLESGFHPGSHLNDDLSDGDGFYSAFGQLGSGAAVATAEGLWVTTLQFLALDGGLAEVRLEETCEGCVVRTRVVDGEHIGVDITGTLGPPAQVQIVGCALPLVETIGCRYLAVTPGFAGGSVALLVTGVADDSAVNCVSLYVQADGTLAAAPIHRLPEEWGTVHVTGVEIRPDTIYHIRTDCGRQTPGLFSSPMTSTTWVWGDTDGDGDVGIDDVIRVSDGAQGVFGGGVRPENVELLPCVPDGEINTLDVDAARDAFAGAPFPCSEPCGLGPNLDDLAWFVSCMAGPEGGLDPECDAYDLDSDGDSDLADFGVFQRTFGGSDKR